jgi:hypothetical protein
MWNTASIGLAVVSTIGILTHCHSNPNNSPAQEDADPFTKFLKTYLPFTNELAGVLEHSGFKLFKGLYTQGTLSRMGIDSVALTSIAWNAVDETQKKSLVDGLLKAIGLILFSFLLPGTFIPFFQNLIASNIALLAGPVGRLLSGMLSIGILETGVKIWDDYITPTIKRAIGFIHHKVLNKQ